MNLWQARGAVRNVKPNCTPDLADQFLNKGITSILDRWHFSDLLRRGAIVIPDAYTAGTIALTSGSPTVTGTGTAWPVSDKVNTTLAQAVTDLGYTELQPASMSNIGPGMYVVIEMETPAAMEIVPVMATDATTFTVYCQFPHNAGATVQASSLSNLQLWVSDYVFTVTAILSATQARLDMPWGGPPLTGAAYQIYAGYVQVSPTARVLKHAWDPVQGQPVGVQRTLGWLNAIDPQRTDSNQPQELVKIPPHPSGVMQWEVWPRQLSAYLLSVVYDDGWPRLVHETDMMPPFLNPEIIVSGAQADALLTRVIPRDSKVDPFYDPVASKIRRSEAEQLLEYAIQADEGRYPQHLQNYVEQTIGGGSYNFYRSHPGWPIDFEGD